MAKHDSALTVEHLSRQYRNKGRKTEAVTDVSFTLEKGEILGVVGESGSGKSTLLRLISCMEKADAGKIWMNGKDITGKRTREICSELQMIFQNPVGSFNPRRKVGVSIDENLRYFTGAGREEAAGKRDLLLEQVGLTPELAERYPAHMSGGQCQRFAIARALAADPHILLCDEITSALDVAVQGQIMCLLTELREKRKLSILFVTHDLALAAGFCDRLLILQEGRCVEEGTPEQLIRCPQAAYTRELISAAFLWEELCV